LLVRIQPEEPAQQFDWANPQRFAVVLAALDEQLAGLDEPDSQDRRDDLATITRASLAAIILFSAPVRASHPDSN
jgi:hypothetical protein